ncbi:hypothetical protein PGTUg99_011687 [Puccinia graminis f. sp. tritici]|uniref:Uncharacterized protein n=1 Tax=Puccinia graminis f. sp. tritici TaxID=56615 RepID=A0A5B0SHS3_PUCGR|nr:hypothetical protein PGTUg99_011687 [Puccinia graminis f. sp. tritici]
MLTPLMLTSSSPILTTGAALSCPPPPSLRTIALTEGTAAEVDRPKHPTFWPPFALVPTLAPPRCLAIKSKRTGPTEQPADPPTLNQNRPGTDRFKTAWAHRAALLHHLAGSIKQQPIQTHTGPPPHRPAPLIHLAGLIEIGSIRVFFWAGESPTQTPAHPSAHLAAKVAAKWAGPGSHGAEFSVAYSDATP